jgi:hypothetical protein
MIWLYREQLARAGVVEPIRRGWMRPAGEALTGDGRQIVHVQARPVLRTPRRLLIATTSLNRRCHDRRHCGNPLDLITLQCLDRQLGLVFLGASFCEEDTDHRFRQPPMDPSGSTDGCARLSARRRKGACGVRRANAARGVGLMRRYRQWYVEVASDGFPVDMPSNSSSSLSSSV